MATEGVQLPASGLAEEILGDFIRAEEKKLAERESGETRAESAVTYHLVTFNLGREEYGVEIASVQEIIRATDITPVPGAPAYVRGVINLRGKIIPVVDLRRRFGLPDGETTEQQRIIVVEIGVKRLGMLVDSVSQVLRVPASVVEELPEEASAIDEHYIRGIGKLDQRLVVILDLTHSLLVSGG